MKDGVTVVNPNIVVNDPTTAQNFELYSTDANDAGIYIVTINSEISLASTTVEYSVTT